VIQTPLQQGFKLGAAPVIRCPPTFTKWLNSTDNQSISQPIRLCHETSCQASYVMVKDNLHTEMIASLRLRGRYT